jgi:putative ABC transport system permease protein
VERSRARDSPISTIGNLIGQSAALAEGAAYKEGSFTLAGGRAEPERISGQAVSAHLFSLLGVKPLLGRSFHPDDDRPGAPGVVLISHGLWQRRFSGDRNVLGRSILVDFQEHTIIGIMPPSFAFPDRSEAWIPLAPLVYDNPRTYRDLHVVARLTPGVSLETWTSAAPWPRERAAPRSARKVISTGGS